MPDGLSTKAAMRMRITGKRRLFFSETKVVFAGIRHLLLDLRFFFAYDKSGGTGRNFAAEVPTLNLGAGVPAREYYGGHRGPPSRVIFICSEVAAVCGTDVYTSTCTQRFFAA
jgi:hypothetical protein